MKIRIRFDGHPGHKPAGFIDVEEAETGRSVHVGEWVKDTDPSPYPTEDWFLLLDVAEKIDEVDVKPERTA